MKSPQPVPCGHCIAYLRVDPKKLREVQGKDDDARHGYGLFEQQYIRIADTAGAKVVEEMKTTADEISSAATTSSQRSLSDNAALQSTAGEIRSQAKHLDDASTNAFQHLNEVFKQTYETMVHAAVSGPDRAGVSIRGMDGSTVSSKVVRGKPIKMWRRFRTSPSEIVWAYTSPVLLAVALIKLVFFWSRLSMGGAAFYILMGLVAVVGLFMLAGDRGELRVECECPACEQPVWFTFPRRTPDPELPIALCLKCSVYVTQREGEISEAGLDTSSDRQRFIVQSSQYESAVRRGDNGAFAFDWPSFCAICGTADAPYKREVEHLFSNRGVSSELVREVNYARTGSRGRGVGSSYVSTALGPADFLDQKVAACALHRDPASRPRPLWIGDSGSLYFLSYRYYKAFVAANRVVPLGSMEGLPKARVAS